jgi:hypothetical protein
MAAPAIAAPPGSVMVPENDPWLPFCATEYQNAGTKSAISGRSFFRDRVCIWPSPWSKVFDRDSRQLHWEPPVFVSDVDPCLRLSEPEMAHVRDSSFLMGKLYSCQATWPIMRNLILYRISPGHFPTGRDLDLGPRSHPCRRKGVLVQTGD